MYLGWISVATIANFSVTLYDQGWNGGWISPEAWTVIILLVAMGLGIAMIWLRRGFVYAAVLIWAFIGIIVNQADIELVAISAGISTLISAILFVVYFLKITSPATALKRG